MYGYKEEHGCSKWADAHTDIKMQPGGSNVQGVACYSLKDYIRTEKEVNTLPLDLSVISLEKQARDSESPLDLSLKTRKRHADSTDSNGDSRIVREIGCGFALVKKPRYGLTTGSSLGNPSSDVCSKNTILHKRTFSQTNTYPGRCHNDPQNTVYVKSPAPAKRVDHGDIERIPVSTMHYLKPMPEPEATAAPFCGRAIKQEFPRSCMRSSSVRFESDIVRPTRDFQAHDISSHCSRNFVQSSDSTVQHSFPEPLQDVLSKRGKTEHDSCFYGEALQRCSPDSSTNGSLRVHPQVVGVGNLNFHPKTSMHYSSTQNTKSPVIQERHASPVSWRQSSLFRDSSPDSPGLGFAYMSSHCSAQSIASRENAQRNSSSGGATAVTYGGSPLAQGVPTVVNRGGGISSTTKLFSATPGILFASKTHSDISRSAGGGHHIPRYTNSGNIQYVTKPTTSHKASEHFTPFSNTTITCQPPGDNSYSHMSLSSSHKDTKSHTLSQQTSALHLMRPLQRELTSRNLINAVERDAATANESSGGARAMQSLLQQSAVRQDQEYHSPRRPVDMCSRADNTSVTEKRSDSEYKATSVDPKGCVEVDISKYTLPLMISIPSNGGHGKREVVCKLGDFNRHPHPKLGSKKHIILKAVSQDQGLRQIVGTTDRRVSAKKTCERVEEAGNPPITIAPSSPASPKMPILSPQHKLPPTHVSPLINEPPTLEPPPAAGSVSQVHKILPESEHITKRYLEVPHILHSISMQSKSSLSKVDRPVNCSSPPPPVLTAQTEPCNELSRIKSTFINTRTLHNVFSERHSSSHKNIPVANVAPIIQRSPQVHAPSLDASSPVSERNSPQRHIPDLERCPELISSDANFHTAPEKPMPSLKMTRKCELYDNSGPMALNLNKSNMWKAGDDLYHKNNKTTMPMSICRTSDDLISNSPHRDRGNLSSSIKRERNIWASMSQSDSSPGERVRPSQTIRYPVPIQTGDQKTTGDGKHTVSELSNKGIDSLKKLSPLMKKMMLQKQLSNTPVVPVHDDKSEQTKLRKSENEEPPQKLVKQERDTSDIIIELSDESCSSETVNRQEEALTLSECSDPGIKSRIIKQERDVRALSTECSEENVLSPEAARPKVRRSLLDEIANSDGYIMETKNKAVTDDLLVDPSLLGREERALRRAIELFTKMEQKREKMVKTGREKTTATRKADQLRRKARQPRHTKSKGKIELGMYHRNAAYEKELRKEESRHAARRRARLRKRAQELGQKSKLGQNPSRPASVDGEITKKNKLGSHVKKVSLTKSEILSPVIDNDTPVPKRYEDEMTVALDSEANAGREEVLIKSEKLDDTSGVVETNDQIVTVSCENKHNREISNNAEIVKQLEQVVAINEGELSNNAKAVHKISKTSLDSVEIAVEADPNEPLNIVSVNDVVEPDHSVTEGTDLKLKSKKPKSNRRVSKDSVKPLNNICMEKFAESDVSTLERVVPLKEKPNKRTKKPCKSVNSLSPLIKAFKKRVDSNDATAKHKTSLEHTKSLMPFQDLAETRMASESPVRMTTRFSEKSEKEKRRSRLRDRARKLGEQSNLRIRTSLKSGQGGPEVQNGEGIWEIRNTSSSLKQTLRSGKSKGGLMIKLSWRPNQVHCFSRRRETRSCVRKTVSASSKVKTKLHRGYIPVRLARHTKGRGRGRASMRSRGTHDKKENVDTAEQEEINDDSVINDKDLSQPKNLEDMLLDHFQGSGEEGNVPIPSDLRRLAISKTCGETLLHRAARLGYEEVALYCLTVGSVDVNARDNAGFTPLHETCVLGNLAVARHLLQHGADVNSASQDGIRPIHDALENDHIEIVRLLLSYGADLTLSTYGGKTSDSIAHSVKMKKLIKGHMADINGPEDESESFEWEFNGSSLLFDDKGENGNDLFSNIPSDPEDELEDLFEFSSRPMFPTYQVLLGGRERCECCVFLSDVLQHFDMSRSEFDGIVGPHVIVRTASKDRIRSALSDSLFRDRYLTDCVESKVSLLRTVELTSVISKLERYPRNVRDKHKRDSCSVTHQDSQSLSSGQGSENDKKSEYPCLDHVTPDLDQLCQSHIKIEQDDRLRSEMNSKTSESITDSCKLPRGQDSLNDIHLVNIDKAYKCGGLTKCTPTNLQDNLQRPDDQKSSEPLCINVKGGFGQFLNRSRTLFPEEVYTMKVGTIPEECFDDFIWTTAQSGCDVIEASELVKGLCSSPEQLTDNAFMIDR